MSEVNTPKEKNTISAAGQTISSELLLPASVIFLAVALCASMIISASILGRSIKESGIGTSANTNTAQTTPTPTTIAKRGPNPGEFTVEGVTPSQFYLGDPNAKVKMYYFSDLECYYCHQFHVQSFAQLKKEYIDTGKVQFFFKHYPNSQIHPNPKDAAMALMCASEQGKFWEYYTKVFDEDITTQQTFKNATLDNFAKWAKELGMDDAKLRTCYDSKKYSDYIDKDFNELNTLGQKYSEAAAKNTDIDQSQVGLGTPTFLVNNRIISGALPYDVFQSIINQELAK